MINFSLRAVLLDYCAIFGGLLLENLVYFLYLLGLKNNIRDLGPIDTLLVSVFVYFFVSFGIIIIYRLIFALLKTRKLIPRITLFLFFLITGLLSSILWEYAYAKMRNGSLIDDSLLNFYFRHDFLIITSLWITFFLVSAIFMKGKIQSRHVE